MTRPSRFLFIVFILAFCGCSKASADNRIPKINQLVVHQCAGILKNTRDTKYDHKTHIKPEKGIYHCDCSGFLCYFLSQFSPEALAVVPIESRCRRQRAVTFHTAFSSNSEKTKPFWKPICRMKDALPGDFFAWRVVVIPKHGNSGHCGIIWEKPVRESDGSYRVRILDSTTTGHKDDRRIDPKKTGLALGTMWFVVNKKGEPIGYHWTKPSAQPTMRPIAIGRLIQIPKVKRKNRLRIRIAHSKGTGTFFVHQVSSSHNTTWDEK